jgi:hypothetical protein
VEDLEKGKSDEDGNLTVVVHRPYRPADKKLNLTFLELVLEDRINMRRYRLVCVGTKRGLTLNITNKEDLPVVARKRSSDDDDCL